MTIRYLTQRGMGERTILFARFALGLRGRNARGEEACLAVEAATCIVPNRQHRHLWEICVSLDVVGFEQNRNIVTDAKPTWLREKRLQSA